LPSGAPKDVCRRNNEPNTRLFFDSSDVLDAIEPVLWKWAITFLNKCYTKRKKTISLGGGESRVWFVQQRGEGEAKFCPSFIKTKAFKIKTNVVRGTSDRSQSGHQDCEARKTQKCTKQEKIDFSFHHQTQNQSF
jgi:hypothetical protein